MPATAERERSVAQHVAREQIRLVYRQGQTGTVGNFAVAAVTSGVCFVAELPWWSQAPLVLVAVVYLRRLWLLRQFARAEDSASVEVWRRRAVLNSLGGGVAWGLMGAAAFPFAPLEVQVYLMVIGAGLTSAGLATLAPVRVGYLAYMAPFMCGLATATALFFPRFPLPMAALLFFDVLVMIRTSREQALTIERSLRLAIENRALAEELDSARARAEEARAKAEAASHAKSEFLARMSHEIRTPMNGVLGVIELLLTGELGPEERRFAETAHQSGRALLSIIEDILDVAKIEAGKVSLEEAPLELEPLLEELMTLFSVAAGRKSLWLGYHLDEAVPVSVRGDAVRLRQVLTNLLGNAIKFTHRGEVLVRIRLASEGRVRFEVNDTGIGLDAEQQQRVFASFEQADSSTTRRYGGTGLGLSIARQLVELMGGRLLVDSALGRGSTFHFELPLPGAPVEPRLKPGLEGKGRVVAVDVAHPVARDNLERWLVAAGFALGAESPALRILDEARWKGGDAAGPPTVVVEHGVGLAHLHEEGVSWVSTPLCRTALLDAVGRALGSTPEGRTTPAEQRFPDARVLVVDDDAVNRSVLKAMLARLGCTAQVAEGGAAALGVLEQQAFDLVFLDCEMPELDGEGVAREVRQREQQRGAARRTPIIALTAHATQRQRERCLAAGMDEMITKPVSVGALGQCLSRWLLATG
ncbi:MAG: ATP-binding protein [Myxococcota bacterium]